MSTLHNLQARKTLAIVQTPAELKWLYLQTENRKDVDFYALVVGDAIAEHYFSGRKKSEDLKLLFLKDLGIDDEGVWQHFRLVKDELKNDTGPEIDEQLHTVSQIDLESGFSDMTYMQAVVEALFDKVQTREIIIPPVRVFSFRSTAYVRNLQNVFYEVAGRRKIRRRLPLHSRLFFLLNPSLASLQQLVLVFLLLVRDTSRKIKHFVSSPIGLEDWQDAVLIVNATEDLERQFNLSLFAAKNKQKCLVWNCLTGDIETLENLQDRCQTGKLADNLIARQSSPVMAISLLKKYFSKTYCSPLSLRVSNGLENLSSLMESRGLASERLFNWRRIVYAARITAKSCDVLSTLKPRLVIASDTIDTSRAISIAAQSLGVRVLATAHGINMYTDSMKGVCALGNVNCFFGANEGHLVETDWLAEKSCGLVAHDNLKKATVTQMDAAHTGKRRVFILTSMFSCSFPNWTNEVFVKWIEYGEMLRELVTKLSIYSATTEVIIKSHPLVDDHQTYDWLKNDFPELITRHWSEPIDLSSKIPSDVIVLFNCISTLTFAAIEQGLPVVGFWGALTPLAQRNLVVNQLHGTEHVSQLAQMILEILHSPDGATARKARARAEQVFKRFVEPTNLGLAEAVDFTLNLKF